MICEIKVSFGSDWQSGQPWARAGKAGSAAETGQQAERAAYLDAVVTVDADAGVGGTQVDTDSGSHFDSDLVLLWERS